MFNIKRKLVRYNLIEKNNIRNINLTKKNTALKDKIHDFRQKLDNMLETESVSSNEVLRLSRMLDLLIAEYYNLGKVSSES